MEREQGQIYPSIEDVITRAIPHIPDTPEGIALREDYNRVLACVRSGTISAPFPLHEPVGCHLVASIVCDAMRDGGVFSPRYQEVPAIARSIDFSDVIDPAGTVVGWKGYFATVLPTAPHCAVVQRFDGSQTATYSIESTASLALLL